MKINLESISVSELLQIYVQIIDELKTRNVTRTINSPLGDYAEWLAADKLGLTLMPNSTFGFDAVDLDGARYQIKCRRLTKNSTSIQLSAIRNLQGKDFDYLIVILFNEKIEIQKVLKIPYHIIINYAQFRQHVNAHILTLRNNFYIDPLVKDITSQFLP